MSQPFQNDFDKLLVNLVDIMAQTLAPADAYGVSNPTLEAVATNIPASVCLGKGKTKEEEAGKKIATNWRTVYMRPWYADPAPDGNYTPNHVVSTTTYNTQPLTVHHWLRFNGQRLNISQIDDPSSRSHHWAVYCKLVIT